MSDTITPFAPILPGDLPGGGLGGGIDVPPGENPFTPSGGGGLGGSVSGGPRVQGPAGKPPAPANKPPEKTVEPQASATDGQEQQGETLWIRKWELTVGTPSGSPAMDLSLLDFEFTIDQQIYTPPWSAKIKIWNPGENVIERMNQELRKVQLKAGYQQPSKQYGDLFHGQINFFKHGRANATDTFVEIYATQWDVPLSNATVNTWLPAGYETKDEINAVLTALTPYGITLGQLPDDLDKTKRPRGRVVFGMARDYLRDIERTTKGKFMLDQQGKLHLLKQDDVLKMANETVPVLNAQTGLIDVATQTLDGAVEVQCLLNPAIQPGKRIKINNKDLVEVEKIDVSQLPNDAFQMSLRDFSFHADGFYKVGHVRHSGQNRGNPWYTQITTEKSPLTQQPGIKTSIA